MHPAYLLLFGMVLAPRPRPPVPTGPGNDLAQPRLVASSLDRARFFEESREDIYHENKKNVWEALALALFPTLFYKPIAIGLAWHYCDVGEDKTYLAFLTAVPTAGFGSFYSEWDWAGAIASAGDLVGSFLVAWYFYNDHQSRNQPGGSMTLFYAGLGVSGFFWLFDLVMGPVGSLYFNRKLRQRYLAASPAPRRSLAVLPDSGLPTIGPRSGALTPVIFAYSGRF